MHLEVQHGLRCITEEERVGKFGSNYCSKIYTKSFHQLSLQLILLKFFDFFRGEVINGGFGLVLDGSDEAASKAESMLNWDVSNGVARR